MAKVKTKNNDIFDKVRSFEACYKRLEKGTYFQDIEDNRIVKIYVDAKHLGHYRRIVYNVSKPESTCLSNLHILKFISEYFTKPIHALEQHDIDKLQIDLNRNAIYTKTKPTRGVKNTPITFEYKRTIVKTLKQFWTFYRLYMKEEHGVTIENILEYLKLYKPVDHNEDIQFFTLQELFCMTKTLKSLQMRAFYLVAFELGGRVVEMLTVRRLNCRKENGKWSIILPQAKGISASKKRIELDISNKDFDMWMNSKEFEANDYIFSYTYSYWRKSLYLTSKSTLGRIITPRIFRKSCTMYLIKLNAPEQYIKSHLGWSVTTKAMGRYVNQSVIEKPQFMTNAIKKEIFPDIEKENLMLKEQQKAQNNLLSRLQNQLEQQQAMLENIIRKQSIVDLNSQEDLLLKIAEGIKSKMPKD